MRRLLLTICISFSVAFACMAQSNGKKVVTDSNTPLHLLQPQYDTPYDVPNPEDVKSYIDRIKDFIERGTPMELVNKDELKKGIFRLASYEWGVTYQGMIGATKATGDASFKQYSVDRLSFLAKQYPHFKDLLSKGKKIDGQMRQVVDPHALDDAGAVCTAMIKAQLEDSSLSLKPLIENYIDFIMNKEYRLDDNIFARNRPQRNTVWLDDMFMAIPAIVWYGRYTGETKYYDEAITQVHLFVDRMWVEEKQLFRHGWVEEMQIHPSFHWARANGWAILTLTEILDALPENYSGREYILEMYRKHIAGLQSYQSKEGFWHQLLDRNDSYLETSATSIYTYCIAHGINKRWIGGLEFFPTISLAWNAITTRITDEGMVEGTCVGTGMGFDPAFYYYRPQNAYAAHGYGPTILAGAEMYQLLNTFHPRTNDSAVQFYKEDYSKKDALFNVDSDKDILW